MDQPRLVCLSLTPNLRCVGFTLWQLAALIVPPAIEVIISLLFIYSCSGPGRRAQIPTAIDGILYFIWVLLDTLSHIVPAVRTSSSIFRVLDFLIGAVSFTPILVYSIYLYRLGFRYLIPPLPRKFHPYLEISLPILLVIAVAMNEVSSFVGTHLDTSSNQPLVIFSNNSEFLWLSLSHASLTMFTITQFLFFLLAFARLSRSFLDQRRIELARSDEHHRISGIAWITTGIIIGVIETIAGFADASFGLTLARRILRLISRSTLMFGVLKGPTSTENFENLANARTFRRMSQSYSEPSRAAECSSAEKRPREQRVTVHYEKGQAPSLQIRFSTVDFPAQAILADVVHSGLNLGRTNTGSSAQQHRENASDESATGTRAAMPGTSRATSAPVTGDSRHVLPEWTWPPVGSHTRRGSWGAVSDTRSIVQDLERKFPNLPPRVTGKYRGSILGQNYEEDPFPVVGISRQSSTRRDEGAHHPSEKGGASVTLSSSGSIKRKPAPPLLDIPYISDQRKRPASAWGGLTQNTVNYPVISPVNPNSPSEGSTMCSPDLTHGGEPNTPRSRRATTHNLLKRAGRALSDASIRSAEWLASAMSPQSPRTPLTAADIEMYRRGDLGPRAVRSTPGDEALLSGGNLLPKASRRSTNGARAHS